MFGKIIFILFILWILGFSFKIGEGLIHLLLIFALVALIIRLLS